MKKVNLHEFNATELKALLDDNDKVVAITTFGSCESHGWHCCLGPDHYVPTEIASRVAMRLDNVVVAPGVPYGTSIHYNTFPLSISLSYETIIAVAQDIFESLYLHGIKRIYILNGHDGNIPALEIAARKVKAKHKDIRFLYLPDWWVKVGERMDGKFDVWNGLGHGGEGETSIMMAINEDLVDLSLAQSQIPEQVNKVSKLANVIWDIEEVSNTGATGDSTVATKEKGQMMLDHLVDIVAEGIELMNANDWQY